MSHLDVLILRGRCTTSHTLGSKYLVSRAHLLLVIKAVRWVGCMTHGHLVVVMCQPYLYLGHGSTRTDVVSLRLRYCPSPHVRGEDIAIVNGYFESIRWKILEMESQNQQMV